MFLPLTTVYTIIPSFILPFSLTRSLFETPYGRKSPNYPLLLGYYTTSFDSFWLVTPFSFWVYIFLLDFGSLVSQSNFSLTITLDVNLTNHCNSSIEYSFSRSWQNHLITHVFYSFTSTAHLLWKNSRTETSPVLYFTLHIDSLVTLLTRTTTTLHRLTLLRNMCFLSTIFFLILRTLLSPIVLDMYIEIHKYINL